MHLGIDIGTHLARAAYLDLDGHPQPVRLPDGSDVLPAMARQTMHGLTIGRAAAQSLAGNTETTLCGCTRLMGQAGRLPAQLLERLPYAVRQVEGEAICNLLYAEVRAGEVYGHLARTLVEAAALALGQKIDDVVLTIPASAEDRFRVQVRAAVEAQGLSVRRLINQPTAALLAASLPAPARHVAVVHCGGGSIDASLAGCKGTDIRILATAGNMLLGGDDLAWSVAEQLNRHFRRTAAVDVFAAGRSRVAALGLRSAAEQALQTLSLAPQMTLVLDHGGGFGRDLVTVIQRHQLDAWLAPLLKQVREQCQRTLTVAHLRPDQIDAVLLTGDWSYLPALRQTIADVFHQPIAALHTENASLLPVYGAALVGAGQSGTIWDVTPYPLGINCYYGNTELFSPIIEANTPIPTPTLDSAEAYTQSYQTRQRDQTGVTLDILQYRGPETPDPSGPSPVRPDKCEVLGSWTFDGLHPKKGKRAAFTVTFAIDLDGILQLYARETATGHHLEARVARGIGD